MSSLVKDSVSDLLALFDLMHEHHAEYPAPMQPSARAWLNFRPAEDPRISVSAVLDTPTSEPQRGTGTTCDFAWFDCTSK